MSSQFYHGLLTNLMNDFNEISATAVVFRNGLIVANEIRDPQTQDELIGALTASFDRVIMRVQKDIGSAKEVLDIITINQSKYIFISAGTNAILTIISEENTPDQRLKVYGFHVAKKIELYIDEKPVDIEIPQYIEVLANMRQDSIPTGQFKMKIAIIGDPGVGKKSFVN